MLIKYQQETRRLLNDQQFTTFNDFDLVEYINQGRRQIALDAAILRQPAELTMVVGQQAYLLSSAVYVPIPTLTPGLGSIVLVRSAALKLEQGFRPIEVRPWEYFENYELDRLGVVPDQPRMMAQQLLGADIGTLWFAPPPDDAWVVRLYPISIPIDLVDDTTSEALPLPWQDAVPYYAAHVAYLTKGNKEGADDMWERYTNFQTRADSQVTGTQLPQNYPVFRRLETPTERK